jgi:O-succinylbenzoic acid--CoA ligase
MMIFNKPENLKMGIEAFIILNGKKIDSREISELIKGEILADWERELYMFMNDWFSDTGFILAQTSGSTGEPKAIELPKSIMRKSAERTIEYFNLQRTDNLLLSLPCRYIAGKMMVVRAIVGQMNLVTVDPSTDFRFLENEVFDFGALVPNQVIKILEQQSGQQKLQNIKNLLIGGSAIPTELSKQVAPLKNRVVSTYGMTETASHIAIRELSGPVKSEFYHCLAEITVSLQENGCLQIHLSDFHEPLKTNDLAELQSDTSFRILGRADSVIISGGAKYSPESIEKKLEKLIQQPFAISSVADEKLGERIVLVIEGDCLGTEDLEEKMRSVLPTFERPKAIIFVQKFPLTESSKIRRKELKQMIQKCN